MIIHRGLHKKWTGMMIPEHVQLLKQSDEQQLRYPKEKTDWELEDLQQAVLTAFNTKQRVELLIWKNDKWVTLQGAISALKSQQQLMLFETDTLVNSVAFQEIDRLTVIVE